MNTITDNSRHFLSYPNATYHLTRAWFLSALFFLVATVALGRLLPRTGFGGPPMVVILSGFATFFCLASGIADAIFVYRNQNLVTEVTFDSTNLYLGADDTAAGIPLHCIAYIRLAYTPMRSSTRGFSSKYEIGYEQSGLAEEVTVAIYYKSRKDFALFRDWVKQANPRVEIKNWALNFKWGS